LHILALKYTQIPVKFHLGETYLYFVISVILQLENIKNEVILKKTEGGILAYFNRTDCISCGG